MTVYGVTTNIRSGMFRGHRLSNTHTATTPAVAHNAKHQLRAQCIVGKPIFLYYTVRTTQYERLNLAADARSSLQTVPSHTAVMDTAELPRRKWGPHTRPVTEGERL